MPRTPLPTHAFDLTKPNDRRAIATEVLDALEAP